jgi:uncharacterized membrane protein SpoIIM required for sporulation
MKVSDLLESRRAYWRELEDLCDRMSGRSRRRMPAAMLTRFSSLYRAACADLALADAYQLPPATIQYLHQLVGRAHNKLYRSKTFDFGAWFHDVFVTVPQQLFSDNALRLAFVLFWGAFILSSLAAYHTPGYAERVMGKEMVETLESSFATPPNDRNVNADGFMAGFYIAHNTTIGIRCFVFGLLFGIGGLYETLFNALVLGSAFGYMASTPQADNFFHFVTAHGPFELTAVVLSAATGMRLGFSLIHTEGYSRGASLRRASKRAMPTLGLAVLLFLMAAFIEGFISPSPLPYAVKAGVGIATAGMLMFYFVFLGYPRTAAGPAHVS